MMVMLLLLLNVAVVVVYDYHGAIVIINHMLRLLFPLQFITISCQVD